MLPDSTIAVVSESTTGKVKTGRPSALDLQRRTVRAISALDAWASSAIPEHVLAGADSSTTDNAYVQSKRTLTENVPSETIAYAEQSTISKMKQLEDIYMREGWDLENRDGLITLEQALKQPDRLLGLTRSVHSLTQNAQPSPGTASIQEGASI